MYTKCIHAQHAHLTQVYLEGDSRHWMSTQPPSVLPFLAAELHNIGAHVATMAGTGATQVDVSAASMAVYDARPAYRYV